jgi:hypothetical protein
MQQIQRSFLRINYNLVGNNEQFIKLDFTKKYVRQIKYNILRELKL